MAYEPTTWVTGDIVSSERLNKMEQGIADALPKAMSPYNEQDFFVIPYDYDTGETEVTPRQLSEANSNGKLPMFGGYQVVACSVMSGRDGSGQLTSVNLVLVSSPECSIDFGSGTSMLEFLAEKWTFEGDALDSTFNLYTADESKTVAFESVD